MSKRGPYRAKTKHWLQCALCDYRGQYRSFKKFHWNDDDLDPHPEYPYRSPHDRYLQLSDVEDPDSGLKNPEKYPPPPPPSAPHPVHSLGSDNEQESEDDAPPSNDEVDPSSNDEDQDDAKALALEDVPAPNPVIAVDSNAADDSNHSDGSNEPNTVCEFTCFCA